MLSPTTARNVFKHLLVAVAGIILGLQGTAASAEDFTIVLTAGATPLPPSPVQFELPAGLRDGRAIKLKNNATGQWTPVQLDPDRRGQSRQATFVTQSELKAGAARQYTLRAAGATSAASSPMMTAVDAGGGRVARKSGAVVLRYNAAVQQPPKGVAAHYRSSGHIHPVLAPNGESVTSEFPADHLHQHALFGAWVKTKFKGRNVDFWNQGKTTGRVMHHQFRGAPVQGDAYCEFTAVRRHVAMDVQPPEHVLEETWSVRVYNTPGYQLFDIHSYQQLAPGNTKPLMIAKYHYGGMALRGRDEWLPGSVQFFSDAADDRLKGNGKPAHWVVMAGKMKEGEGGVAVLSHRDNFRAPQPVRLHPKMPYFCFMPAVNEPFAIEQDKPFASRYRYCVFNGKVDVKLIDALSKAYKDTADYKISIRPADAAGSRE